METFFWKHSFSNMETFLFKQKPKIFFSRSMMPRRLSGAERVSIVLVIFYFSFLLKVPLKGRQLCYNSKFHHFEFLPLGDFLLRELSLSEPSPIYFSSFLRQI